MKKLLIFFFLISCASPNQNVKTINTKLDFNDELSFDDFNKLLIEYVKTGQYPNIDK